MLHVLAVADGEFSHFEQVAEQQKSELPAFCESFRHVEFIGLLIPLAVLARAWVLLCGDGCSFRQLVWFTCGTFLAIFLWATVSFLAVYMMHLRFYR